jgi:hypothetical protein
MFTVVEQIEVATDAASVFAFLTDPSRRGEWDRSVISERLLTPEPPQVGSEIRTRMSVLGREVEFDWRVIAFDPPSTMAATSTSGMMPTDSRFEIVPMAGGCLVTATITGSPSGMMLLAEPIVSGSVRTTLAAGLRRAKSLLEAG